MALFMHVEVVVRKICKQTEVLHPKLPLAKDLSSGIWPDVTNENLNF